MKTTKKMLRKQDIEGYNLISLPTIQLTPIEADKFLDCIYDESVMKHYARFEKMAKPTKYIRHLGFGSGKFLYPGHNFNEAKYKKQFTHNRMTLKAEKIRGCVPIYDDDLEEGLEGAAYKNHIMGLITKQIANELEYAFYMGDAQGYNSWTADDIESLWDGWRYIINNSQSGDTYYNDVCGAAHIKDACDTESGAEWDLPGMIAEQDAAAPYNWEFKYARAIKNMPAKYKAAFGLKNFVFMNSDLVTQDYIEALSARSTALGDAVFTGAAKPAYGNVPIVDVPLMPTNLGTDGQAVDDYGIIGGGDYTDVMLTYKGNLIIGMQKEIKIEPQRSASDECTYYFYTMKVALAIENVNAIVFIKCLTHAC